MSTSDFEVLVVGHLCLDVIPELHGNVTFQPGSLVEAGAAQLTPGGAVANVGTILSRLGVGTKLVAKVGSDRFGVDLLSLVRENAPSAKLAITEDSRHPTSYTIVLNLAGEDRMFLHCPGANREFRSQDVSNDDISVAKWMHLGYPPLLESLYAEQGSELSSLLKRAKEGGVTTSLDLSFPDPNSKSGRADWRAILANALPYVDYFLPSLNELAFMLGTASEQPDELELAKELAKKAMVLGARNVGIKLGERGLFYESIDGKWYQPCFKVAVKGTTGSGDATIAGFIKGVLSGLAIPEVLQLACAAGACCCETPDAVSGIADLHRLEARLLKFLQST